jgi:hypothetical protein
MVHDTLNMLQLNSRDPLCGLVLTQAIYSKWILVVGAQGVPFTRPDLWTTAWSYN